MDEATKQIFVSKLKLAFIIMLMSTIAFIIVSYFHGGIKMVGFAIILMIASMISSLLALMIRIGFKNTISVFKNFLK